MSNKTTVNKSEVEKFSKIANEWWNESGPFKPLHQINPVRIKYIKEQICNHFSYNKNNTSPLYNIKLLDIGCGGGLISIPMKKLGADVTGIDASKENIDISSLQAKKYNLDINFINTTSELLATKNAAYYDVVLALEIIEHVDNIDMFIQNLSKLTKQNGLVFISTINKTIRSLLLAKIAAEYILRLVPIGTHSWDKFITPLKLMDLSNKHNLIKSNAAGIKLNILTQNWEISEDTNVNYIITLIKR
jgi:2-polyprenyl-6-hydroxyphenyl methylase/3-demethylubiquinone-9 3-methyltransferase